MNFYFVCGIRSLRVSLVFSHPLVFSIQAAGTSPTNKRLLPMPRMTHTSCDLEKANKIGIRTSWCAGAAPVSIKEAEEAKKCVETRTDMLLFV